MTWSLRARLTAFYTFALVVVLCLFSANVWWVEGRLGLRRVDRELDGLSSTVARLLSEELGELGSIEAAAKEVAGTISVPDRAIAFLDADGRLMAGSSDRLAWSDVHPLSRDLSRLTAHTRAGSWRIRSEPRVSADAPVTLVVGSSLRDVERQQHEVLETMWIALPIVLLLAGGGGWWLAAMTLAPITDMARQAAQITTNGTETLGDDARKDELGTLATAFNGLLARQRDALRTQRQFMADASHELRTPVSVVRTASDVALSRSSRDEADYRETLSIIGTQARRLSRLVESMLVLARADGGGYPVRRIDLYLDEIVAECCGAVAMLCNERQVTICGGPWPETPFHGDEELLRQLVLNVLQNAVQHTSAGGTVTVDLTTSAAAATITIRDSGPGIPTADRARIFERFVRLDAARTGSGAGLGLSIARWIAEQHGGSLVLAASDPDGSMFRIDLAQQPAHQGGRTCDTAV